MKRIYLHQIVFSEKLSKCIFTVSDSMKIGKLAFTVRKKKHIEFSISPSPLRTVAKLQIPGKSMATVNEFSLWVTNGNNLGTSFIGGYIQSTLVLYIRPFFSVIILVITCVPLQHLVCKIVSWFKANLHLGARGDPNALQTSHSLCWSVFCVWIHTTEELHSQYTNNSFVYSRFKKRPWYYILMQNKLQWKW